jgi:hypothetical protein
MMCTPDKFAHGKRGAGEAYDPENKNSFRQTYGPAEKGIGPSEWGEVYDFFQQQPDTYNRQKNDKENKRKSNGIGKIGRVEPAQFRHFRVIEKGDEKSRDKRDEPEKLADKAPADSNDDEKGAGNDKENVEGMHGGC